MNVPFSPWGAAAVGNGHSVTRNDVKLLQQVDLKLLSNSQVDEQNLFLSQVNSSKREYVDTKITKFAKGVFRVQTHFALENTL